LSIAEAMHMHEYEISTPVQAHLRRAVTSLESGNTADAGHHLQHAIQASSRGSARGVTDAEHV
jgi:hypothetical protein